jgi:hypothetical protein
MTKPLPTILQTILQIGLAGCADPNCDTCNEARATPTDQQLDLVAARGAVEDEVIVSLHRIVANAKHRLIEVEHARNPSAAPSAIFSAREAARHGEALLSYFEGTAKRRQEVLAKMAADMRKAEPAKDRATDGVGAEASRPSY